MKNYENGRIIVAFAVVVVIVVVGTAAAVAADTHTQYINDKMSQRKQEEVKIYERKKKKYHPLFDWCELSTAWIFVYVCDAFERQRGTEKK